MTGPAGAVVETMLARDPDRIPDEVLVAYLEEDMGPGLMDATTDTVIVGHPEGRAVIVARQECVVSGLELAARVLRLAAAGPADGIKATLRVREGDHVRAGTTLLEVEGSSAVILRGERVALNLLGRMCGIATATAAVQRAVAAVNPSCRVAATRKTTPGFRAFEKLAVLQGGGDPHRFGLDDAVMVKDNHRAAAGLESALVRLRERYPLGSDAISWLEVEVETLEEAKVALRHRADWILVDNHDADTFASMAQAIRALDPKVRIEASGGITAETAPHYAPHADRISMGCLTQSVQAIDVGLDWIVD